MSVDTHRVLLQKSSTSTDTGQLCRLTVIVYYCKKFYVNKYWSSMSVDRHHILLHKGYAGHKNMADCHDGELAKPNLQQKVLVNYDC